MLNNKGASMISSVWEEKVCSAIFIPFKKNNRSRSLVQERFKTQSVYTNLPSLKKQKRQQSTNLKVTDIWSWYNYVELYT